ncbi:hypothetical protein [Nocardia donostiensis]|uniref:hypothetical protein n=1 Tax=Nocardia donostiensis TaxID=1538463 RepID=UPI00111C328E|nr:hypothetical protein [Nocardia donostiensis]
MNREIAESPSGAFGADTPLDVDARVATVFWTENTQVAAVTRTRGGFGEQEANIVGIHRLHRIAVWRVVYHYASFVLAEIQRPRCRRIRAVVSPQPRQLGGFVCRVDLS